MPSTIYEFFHEFGQSKFHSCTTMVVKKETEKTYFGTVYYHGAECGDARIAKCSIGKAIPVENKMRTVLRVRVIANDFATAEALAAEIVYLYYLNAAVLIKPLTKNGATSIFTKE